MVIRPVPGPRPPWAWRRAPRPDPAPLRVALFGLLGSGNIGNAASASAVLAHLARHPGVAPSAITAGPEAFRQREGVPAVSLTCAVWEGRDRSARAGLLLKVVAKALFPLRVVRLLRRLDVVVVPGTGILEDTLPTRPGGMPWSLACLAAVGRYTGTPVVLLGVGATVSRHAVTRSLARSAARDAAYRSFRDGASRQAVAVLGVDTSEDPVVPDLVFGLPVPAPEPHDPDGDTVVAVGVLAHRGRHEDRAEAVGIHATYTARMIALVGRLLDDGHVVRLVTGAPGDEAVAARLREAVAAARPHDAPRVLYDPVDSLDTLMAQLAEADAVVASRFHNVLCALRLARPTVALGYATKHTALMELMGVGEYSRDLDEFDVEEVHGLVRRALDDGDRLVPLLRARDAQARRRLSAQWADLDRFLGLADPLAPLADTPGGPPDTVRSPADTPAPRPPASEETVP